MTNRPCPCGAPAATSCESCETPLCRDHASTSDGTSFCFDGVGCDLTRYRPTRFERRLALYREANAAAAGYRGARGLEEIFSEILS